MSYIGPITNEILEACIREFKKKDTKDRINKYVVDPIMKEFLDKCFSYILIYLVIQMIIIMFLVYISIKLRNINC